MNIEDHNLIVTMEECSETITELTAVIQRASKQLRFGRDEVQPGQERANHERLRFEILDVLGCIRILQHSKQIDPITEADVDEHFRAKQEKIDRMLAISKQHGRIEDNLRTLIDGTDMTPRGKPCTCDNCLGSSTRCRVELGGCRVELGERLGDLWYCRKQAEQARSQREQ